MDCSETEKLIHAHLDRELDVVRDTEVEAHLANCVRCSQAYESVQALSRKLQDASLYFRAPSGLAGRVRSAVRAEEARRAGRTKGTRRSGWLRRVWAPAAALAAVAIAWAVFALAARRSANQLLAQEVVSAHIRSLMANHLTDVASSDQHTVKPWFNGRLDFSPSVRDLAPQGFPLVGGRLDYLAGHPVAALVYQRRQHLINVFVWSSESGSALAGKPISRHGYNLIPWQRDQMAYWAVSDLNPGELAQFVQLLKSQ